MNNGTPKKPNLELESILNSCSDSPGYLLFAAVLSPRRDAIGNNMIDFQYRRYHMNLEDAKQAAAALKKFIDQEIEKLMVAGEEQ